MVDGWVVVFVGCWWRWVVNGVRWWGVGSGKWGVVLGVGGSWWWWVIVVSVSDGSGRWWCVVGGVSDSW